MGYYQDTSYLGHLSDFESSNERYFDYSKFDFIKIITFTIVN
jgi:hypothetical protein